MQDKPTATIKCEGWRCKTPGCTASLCLGVLTIFDSDRATLACQCEAGHKTVVIMDILGEELEKITRPPQPERAVRTKVTGVTFENPDGTKRQTILQHVRAGDPLQIIKGSVGETQAFFVKHALGILGTVRKDAVSAFVGANEASPVHAKVIQVTGGTAEKTTFGCNIEILSAPQPEPQATDLKNTPSAQGISAAGQVVYIERLGRSIYHLNRNCSGLKDVTVEKLGYAKSVLRARPCKKCAAASAAREETKHAFD